ncbi:hypothetical protein H8A95_09125 [Bradyrhizobium sp. Pear76]|uniref:hypothetical protein n=1 Tax=Bradyrhizobium oropedii TaxID=1571201 RepID=UPI001E507EDD|nr:hypothetical protein [Bradyrhizobium oropedii]MCC8962470.1 hypothetical protein [Bradyrhizobium oropedii]
MVGGSHTNFNAGAFTAGAVGGALTIAGAIGAGIANVRAQRQAAFADWNERQLRAALNLSEALRAREHRINQAQQLTIARLQREHAVARAIRHLQNK